MSEHLLTGLGLVLIVGVAAQWLAWRLQLPSILLLLLSGFLLGPVTGLLDPDRLFGPLLAPLVSISVAIILYEGGLSLDLAELSQVGGTVWRLITLGALVTFATAWLGAVTLLVLPASVSLILAAVLVVTGPTVITPLLRHIRPSGRVGAVLHWEGILIDPLGAALAVLLFETAVLAESGSAGPTIAWGVARTLGAGAAVGLGAAALLVALLRHYWVAEFLENGVSLMLVMAALILADWIQPEAGLLAVTLMGIALANQRWVDVRHIIEFKENLKVLLLSVLFILLAARLTLSDLGGLNLPLVGFLVLLVLVGRPLAVLASTLGSGFSWPERLFLAWMAPRGIVAAAVASIFAFELARRGQPGAERLVPITFTVIVGTIVLYGLTGGPLARRLGVARPDPQGLVLAGAHAWARALASTLQERGYAVVLVDSNWHNISRARMEGLPIRYGNILSKYTQDHLLLDGIGKLVALTSNDEVNSLAALHFAEVFGRQEVYQLPPEGVEGSSRGPISQHLRGRLLFDEGLTFREFTRAWRAGAKIAATHLGEEFDWETFQKTYRDEATPLFLIRAEGPLRVFTARDSLRPRPGDILISLLREEESGGSPQDAPAV